MEIYHLHLIESRTDISELKEKLAALSIDTKFFNDLGFCPHFIVARNPDEGTWFCDNTNDGHFAHLQRTHQVVDCETLDDLIECIAGQRGNIVIGSMKTGDKNIGKPNALF